MESITPGRTQISDRFPVASFTVRAPGQRWIEIACATDPRLFHRDLQSQRTPRNFFTTRERGLIAAGGPHTTYLLPSGQLQQFAGAQRIYYALATYGSPRGEDARFSVHPAALERAPSIVLSSDFTGRGLDRARVGAAPDARYGSSPQHRLSWGGDDALLATAAREPEGRGRYDDGYGSALWDSARQASAEAPVEPSPEPASAPAATEPAAEELECYDDLDGAAPELSAGPDAPAPGGEAYGSPGPRPAGDRAENPDGYGPAPARAQAYGRPAARAPQALEDEQPDAPEDGFALLRAGEDDSLLADDEVQPGHLEDGAAVAALGAEVPTRVAADGAEDGPAVAALGLPVEVVYEPLPGAPDERYGRAAPVAPRALSLTVEQKLAIAGAVARASASARGYGAVDASFPGEQGEDEGVALGLFGFTQRSGALGKLLRALQRRDRAGFSHCFGPAEEELLRVTCAASADDRLQPVEGRNLWEEPWLSRLRSAGGSPAMCSAQNEVAVLEFLDPQLEAASWLGLDSPRALALVHDRALRLGTAAGLSWVARAVGPVRTHADREAALRALGHPDLRAFQRGARLPETGAFDGRTHAALSGAVRALGARAPLPVDPLPRMLDRLVEAARGTAAHARLQRLLAAPELSETAVGTG